MAEVHREVGPRAAVGSVVRVRWGDEADEEEYTIVSPPDADIGRFMISAATPFAAAVIGHHAGQTVTVRGVGQSCRVAIVSVSHPERVSNQLALRQA